MRPLPVTLEYVERIALAHPARPALEENGAVLTYGRLFGMAAQCARMLRALGLGHGARVAVGGPGIALQTMVLLACEALGVASASFDAEQDPDLPRLAQLVDCVLAGVPRPAGVDVRWVALDPVFMQRLEAARPVDEPWPCAPLASHELARITRTSGSTGAARFVALSRRSLESWFLGATERRVYDASTRLLLLAPFVMNIAYSRVTRCLRGGGTVVIGPPATLEALDPTDACGLPLQVQIFLEGVEAGRRAKRPIHLITVSGHVGPALRRRIQDVFGTPVFSRYGSNEAGGIAVDLDDHGIGILNPGVELRIVDAAGAEVPPGTAGLVHVRTALQADGYVGDDTATAAAFVDGWFRSVDVARIVGPRRLQLLGRADDLINTGGLKVPAARVEDALMAALPLRECAALATIGTHGATLGLVLVPVEGSDPAKLVPALQHALADTLPPMQVRCILLHALPRLPGGKPDRLALQAALRDAGG